MLLDSRGIKCKFYRDDNVDILRECVTNVSSRLDYSLNLELKMLGTNAVRNNDYLGKIRFKIQQRHWDLP